MIIFPYLLLAGLVTIINFTAATVAQVGVDIALPVWGMEISVIILMALIYNLIIRKL